MATIAGEYRVCECCALMIANGDDSGCQDFYGHTHRPASKLTCCAVLASDGEEVWTRYPWNCDGCGDDILPGGTRFDVAILH